MLYIVDQFIVYISLLYTSMSKRYHSINYSIIKLYRVITDGRIVAHEQLSTFAFALPLTVT